MSNLTGTQVNRLARMAGEGHKQADERMLDNATLDRIAGEVAMVRDSAGRAPVADGYNPTVDLYIAAAECWRTKAGMVAEGFNFKADGGEFNRSEVYEHYLKQAMRYAGMSSKLTVEVARGFSDDPDADDDDDLEGGS